MYIGRGFCELDLSRSLKCLEFLDPVDMGIVLAILQLLIALCSLGLARVSLSLSPGDESTRPEVAINTYSGVEGHQFLRGSLNEHDFDYCFFFR